jgi:hypothetical protein
MNWRHALPALLLLAGCATTWTQAGKSELEVKRDLYECEKDAAPIRSPIRAEAMIERCMELKGYSAR